LLIHYPAGCAGLREEAIRLLRQLLERYDEFFDSRGYLNSEGVKVLERVARIVIQEEKWLRGYVARARRRRSYEDVARLLEALTSSPP